MSLNTTTGALRGIAFVGNHLPRQCGIATFTTDLADAVEHRCDVDVPVVVAAMNDCVEGYPYPPRVALQIRQDAAEDYALAAEYFNDAPVDVVCIQHEFGIFGQDGGRHVLGLIDRIRKPVVVTCHTVPDTPYGDQAMILRQMAASATRLVVMSHRARDLMITQYGAEPHKVVIIPHGVHPFPFVEPDSHKARLGLSNRKVLLTFGLLHRQKGIEHMIDAMPGILERHPDATYIILGATHPCVLREEGEVYRHELVRRVERLGVGDSVRFRSEFLELDGLLDHIAGADVCVMPYLSLDQAASGVLAYTMAMGRAIISTPTRYASEMLAEGRGRLVPPADAAALASETIGLLGDERRTMMMRRRVYSFARSMSWPVVAGAYLRLFDEIAGRPATVADLARPAAGARSGLELRH